MDRRAQSLVALLVFVALTGVSIGVSGSRPHLEQGTAPWLLQVLGYVCAITGGVLLAAGAPVGRRLGFVVLGATVVMVLVDAMTTGDAGANIGAGFLGVLCLAVLGVATARLAVALAADRRSAH
ncbi:hypothetical protein [Blastococcus sp. SYSU DS1024]